MSLKVLGKGTISELIKDILPNTFSTIVDRLIEERNNLKSYVIDSYQEFSKWIKAQIEKLNEIKEDCDGEVSK